jgi:hypothetical protein
MPGDNQCVRHPARQISSSGRKKGARSRKRGIRMPRGQEGDEEKYKIGKKIENGC